MKSNNYLLWMLCGILSIGAGFVASQQLDGSSSFLMADDCCDPATDPDCEEDEDDDGDGDADTMPRQIAA